MGSAILIFEGCVAIPLVFRSCQKLSPQKSKLVILAGDRNVSSKVTCFSFSFAKVNEWISEIPWTHLDAFRPQTAPPPSLAFISSWFFLIFWLNKTPQIYSTFITNIANKLSLIGYNFQQWISGVFSGFTYLGYKD